MADAAARFRDTEKGRQQRETLRRLERESGRKRSAIVADLDREIEVGHDQYRRYLRGDTPLRWDQIGVFAWAFKVSQAELTRALGLLNDEIDPAIRARVDEAVGPLPVTEAGRDDMARIAGRLDPAVRRQVLDQIEHVARTERQGHD
jgi:hypothetical protein